MRLVSVSLHAVSILFLCLRQIIDSRDRSILSLGVSTLTSHASTLLGLLLSAVFGRCLSFSLLGRVRRLTVALDDISVFRYVIVVDEFFFNRILSGRIAAMRILDVAEGLCVSLSGCFASDRSHVEVAERLTNDIHLLRVRRLQEHFDVRRRFIVLILLLSL